MVYYIFQCCNLPRSRCPCTGFSLSVLNQWIEFEWTLQGTKCPEQQGRIAWEMKQIPWRQSANHFINKQVSTQSVLYVATSPAQPSSSQLDRYLYTLVNLLSCTVCVALSASVCKCVFRCLINVLLSYICSQYFHMYYKYTKVFLIPIFPIRLTFLVFLSSICCV